MLCYTLIGKGTECPKNVTLRFCCNNCISSLIVIRAISTAEALSASLTNSPGNQATKGNGCKASPSLVSLHLVSHLLSLYPRVFPVLSACIPCIIRVFVLSALCAPLFTCIAHFLPQAGPFCSDILITGVTPDPTCSSNQ